MDQKLSYVRISELVRMAKHASAPPQSKSAHALALIEHAFHLIDEMTIEEREGVMRTLTSWMLVEKFEAKGHAALAGFQRYCIADCLSDDPTWSLPKDIIAPKLMSGTY